MSSISNTIANELALHLFNNADIADIGDAAGLQNSATAGSLYVHLHTAAADIAGETWAIRLDGAYTARDLMQLMASVLAGKTNITDLGGSNASVVFRNLSDTIDKVEATINGSERTAVTIN